MRRAGLRGALTGALALVALQTLVQPGAAGRISGLFAVPAKIARRFIDPTIPGLPDLTKSGSGSGSGKSIPALQGSSGEPPPVRAYPDPFAVPEFTPPASTGGD